MIRTILFFLLVFSTSFAHRVSIFVNQEGNKVIGYAYFADGSPAKHSKVEVYGGNGLLIFKGKTDKNGLFEFQVPQGVSELKVVLYAGLGHKAVQTLKVSAGTQPAELSNSQNSTPAAQNRSETPRGQNFEIEIPAGVETVVITVKTRGGDEEKIILRVSPNTTNTAGEKAETKFPNQKTNKTTEKELQKIKKEIAKETAFPWQSIFCGIGWILGIFGILSFIYGGRTRKG